jgi:hypothetical protein
MRQVSAVSAVSAATPTAPEARELGLITSDDDGADQ